MKKIFLSILLSTLCLCGTVMAVPDQNGAFDVPEIGSITIDGDISDWVNSTEWSEPFIFWNVKEGGTPLTSTTRAKFAWNNAEDMLYVAIETNEVSKQGGGHPVVGIGINIDSVATSGIGSTQVAFDTESDGSVSITNEIQHYKDTYSQTTWADSGIDGVVAAQTNDGTTWTYELAIPFWESWTTMDDKHSLSFDDTVYAYVIMEDELEGAIGTDMTYDGNPGFAYGAFDDAAALTLVSPLAGDANRDGKVDGSDVTILAGNWQTGVGGVGGATWDMGDFNDDGAVDGSDVTILAGNWQAGVAATTASVPEPGTLTLLLGAIVALFAGLRVRKS